MQGDAGSSAEPVPEDSVHLGDATPAEPVPEDAVPEDADLRGDATPADQRDITEYALQNQDATTDVVHPPTILPRARCRRAIFNKTVPKVLPTPGKSVQGGAWPTTTPIVQAMPC